jgi:Protein of unknown function (DUF2459)
MKFTRIAAPLVALSAAACSATAPSCTVPLAGHDSLYVVSRGWHAEIGIPTDQLKGPLAVYHDVFPQARALMFGFGKKTFITAPPESFGEYLLGPVPGPAAIQVTGLAVSPADAYPPGSTITLSLPPGGSQAVSEFLWNELGKDRTGAPRLLSVGSNPVSVFYAARSGYSLFHTCNTWAADALQAAGLRISGDGVVFSGQVMARSERAAASQCGPSTAAGLAPPS